jgi:hypothetical protein
MSRTTTHVIQYKLSNPVGPFHIEASREGKGPHANIVFRDYAHGGVASLSMSRNDVLDLIAMLDEIVEDYAQERQ